MKGRRKRRLKPSVIAVAPYLEPGARYQVTPDGVFNGSPFQAGEEVTFAGYETYYSPYDNIREDKMVFKRPDGTRCGLNVNIDSTLQKKYFKRM